MILRPVSAVRNGPRRHWALAALLLIASPAFGQSNGKGATDAPQAVIGALDKRVGQSADFTLKPGESAEFGRIVITLRNCETRPPHEPAQSAAFVEITETAQSFGKQQNIAPGTIFSGWLFAETPSLNPLQHPTYDVWLKSCTMHFPDGPEPASADGSTKASGVSPSGQARSTTTGGVTN